MVAVHDVARYLLRRKRMSAMKLQKLVYYAQAWHLARYGSPLFRAPIEAWANGPVIRALYDVHRGQYVVAGWPLGDPSRLGPAERRLLDEILETYGSRDAQWLSRQTHAEVPWREARGTLPDGARSSAVIQPATMRSFYARELRSNRTPARVTAE